MPEPAIRHVIRVLRCPEVKETCNQLRSHVPEDRLKHRCGPDVYIVNRVILVWPANQDRFRRRKRSPPADLRIPDAEITVTEIEGFFARPMDEVAFS